MVRLLYLLNGKTDKRGPYTTLDGSVLRFSLDSLQISTIHQQGQHTKIVRVGTCVTYIEEDMTVTVTLILHIEKV